MNSLIKNLSDGLEEARAAAVNAAGRLLDSNITRVMMGAALATTINACEGPQAKGLTDTLEVDSGTNTTDSDTGSDSDADTDSDTDSDSDSDTDSDTDSDSDTDTNTPDPDATTIMSKADCERYISGNSNDKIPLDRLSVTQFVTSRGASASYDTTKSLVVDNNFQRSDETAPVFVCWINGDGVAAAESRVVVIPGTDADPQETLQFEGDNLVLGGGIVTAWVLTFEGGEPTFVVEDSTDKDPAWKYLGEGGVVTDLTW